MVEHLFNLFSFWFGRSAFYFSCDLTGVLVFYLFQWIFFITAPYNYPKVVVQISKDYFHLFLLLTMLAIVKFLFQC